MEDQMNYFRTDGNPEWILIVDVPTNTVEMCVKVQPNSEHGDNSQRAAGRVIDTYKFPSKQQVLDKIAEKSMVVPEGTEIPD